MIETSTLFISLYCDDISPKQYNSLDLTRCLTKQQQADLNERLIKKTELERFVKKLLSEDGIAQIAKDRKNYEEYPHLALRARVLSNAISDAQVATICMLYAALDQLCINPSSVTQFVDKSKQPPKGHEILTPFKMFYSPTLETYSLFEIGREKQLKGDALISKFFRFTPENLELFKDKLKDQPESEKCFHVIELPMGPVSTWSTLYHRLGIILEFFHPVEEEMVLFFQMKRKVLVLPSFTMFATFLKVYCGEDAIELAPILGKCTTRTVEEFRVQDKRIIGIGMTGAPTPLNADSMYAGKLIFSFHDIYHAVRYSLVKRLERRALYRINTLLKEHLEVVGDFFKKEVRVIKWNLIDGELHDSVIQKERFGKVFEVNAVKWNFYTKTLIVDDMVKQADLWKREFNLSREDLLSFEQAMYDDAVSFYQEKEERVRAQATKGQKRKRDGGDIDNDNDNEDRPSEIIENFFKAQKIG